MFLAKRDVNYVLSYFWRPYMNSYVYKEQHNDDDDDDDCFKVAQASRHSGYPLLPNRDSYFSHSCTTTWQPE